MFFGEVIDADDRILKGEEDLRADVFLVDRDDFLAVGELFLSRFR
jgi:archaeosine-15-forming tRNA-guanine transglycosylase